MVGHSPNIQMFLGCMLTSHLNGGPVPSVRLRKGSLARLTINRGPATLQSLLEPRTVRALYSTSTRKPAHK